MYDVMKIVLFVWMRARSSGSLTCFELFRPIKIHAIIDIGTLCPMLLYQNVLALKNGADFTKKTRSANQPNYGSFKNKPSGYPESCHPNDPEKSKIFRKH
jgi:hypothetical protein